MDILNVSDLNVYYGGIHAIKNISFNIKKGEIVSLIGANGAGKTSTLHAISGLVPIKAGEISLNGENITNIEAHKLIKKGMAHVPEGRRIFTQLTVVENLEMGAFTRNDRDEIKADMEKQQNIISSEREKIVKENSVTETQVYKAKNDFKRGSKTKDIKGDVISIKDFYDLYDGESCIVQGEIFSIENMVLKSGKTLKTIRITDGESSLTSKIFLDENEKLDIFEGTFLKLSGKLQLDTYAGNEKTLMINTVNIIEKEVIKKEDTAEEKMVELHAHTKMSEMVGVTDVEDIIKRAKEYGHKAIAITDYSVVHSYPAAFKTAKKFSTDEEKMKAIFGCEMYMIDDEAPMVTNPKDKKIDDEEFVVFDIETTGLNSHTNEIIEIGAVKIKAGRIVDRYSQLINPGISIPYHITEITSITNEQVANQPKIDEVIGKFVEFIGDAVLVAHNAPFDMGFIKRDIKEYLNIDLENSVIDTLQMARDLFPDLKKYGLGDLNKTLGLALEKHHRAVDDSQATANMFIIFLEKYKEKGIEYRFYKYTRKR